MQDVIPSGTLTWKWNLPKASEADQICKCRSRFEVKIYKFVPSVLLSLCALCAMQIFTTEMVLRVCLVLYAVNKTAELCGKAAVKVIEFIIHSIHVYYVIACLKIT